MAKPDRPQIAYPLAAGTRDASQYSRPDVHSVKVFHIATVVDTAACARGPALHSGVVLLADPYCVPAEVYDDRRCRRPGCRAHWDKVPSKPRPHRGGAS